MNVLWYVGLFVGILAIGYLLVWLLGPPLDRDGQRPTKKTTATTCWSCGAVVDRRRAYGKCPVCGSMLT
jgi:hypothetical protein